MNKYVINKLYLDNGIEYRDIYYPDTPENFKNTMANKAFISLFNEDNQYITVSISHIVSFVVDLN